MHRPGSAVLSRTHPIPGHASASQYRLSHPRQRSSRPPDRSTGLPSGNVSNSFSAALIHETGRVFRVIGLSATWFALCRNVVIYHNKCQGSHRGSPSFAPAAAEFALGLDGRGRPSPHGQRQTRQAASLPEDCVGLVLRTENRDLATALPALFPLRKHLAC